MPKILVRKGPTLNFCGWREPTVHGSASRVERAIEARAARRP